jgi:sugar (pentulose or hexulose) kinase
MILAIDLGSTSFKAALFDRHLRPRACGSARLVHHFGRGGCVEIAVPAVHAALRGALAAVRANERSIRLIALTSQAQTFTLVDAAGRALSLALHHTRADLARSVLEALSWRTAGLARRLGLALRDRRVLVAGGGGRQPLWRKLVADALGVDLEVTDAQPLLGAARMAARHLKAVTQCARGGSGISDQFFPCERIAQRTSC